MRILALHCNSFRYELEHFVADRPGVTRIDDEESRSRAYSECLLLLVSVEVDDQNHVRSAAKSVRRIARKCNVNTLVVSGFAHLSETLAPIEESAILLADLGEYLRDESWTVHSTPLGWHKRMNMDIKGDIGAQKFVHI